MVVTVVVVLNVDVVTVVVETVVPVDPVLLPVVATVVPIGISVEVVAETKICQRYPPFFDSYRQNFVK